MGSCRMYDEFIVRIIHHTSKFLAFDFFLLGIVKYFILHSGDHHYFIYLIQILQIYKDVSNGAISDLILLYIHNVVLATCRLHGAHDSGLILLYCNEQWQPRRIRQHPCKLIVPKLPKHYLFAADYLSLADSCYKTGREISLEFTRHMISWPIQVS